MTHTKCCAQRGNRDEALHDNHGNPVPAITRRLWARFLHSGAIALFAPAVLDPAARRHGATSAWIYRKMTQSAEVKLADPASSQVRAAPAGGAAHCARAHAAAASHLCRRSRSPLIPL